MSCAAVVWRDCMLLGASVVLAYRLFLLHMDRGAPWQALTAAVNTLSAGVLTIAAGIALITGTAAAWLGWWQPRAEHSTALLLMLIAGATWCCLARGGRDAAAEELQPWLWLLGGSLLAVEAQRRGMTSSPCLVMLAVGLAMLRAGWLLAAETASTLMRSSSESR